MDERESSTPELRASDAERERAADLLREAMASGRLSVDELDERMRLVSGAKTRTELERLVDDVLVPRIERIRRVPSALLLSGRRSPLGTTVVEPAAIGWRSSLAAFPALAASGDGRIVVISSVAAEIGLPGQAAYGASKAGLVGLARTLAGEWASRGVRCNVVMPG